jgi:hypothetical protein
MAESATDPLLLSPSLMDFLSSNDYLHTLLEDEESEEIDAFALFFKMLEWMEIEGSIIQSYDELILDASSSRIRRRKFDNEDDMKIVDSVLTEVDDVVSRIMSGFFSEFHFACGVLNALLVVYVLAAYPEHLWLLYLIEGLYLLPRNLYDRIRAKPLNRLFSYLDYCWMMNTIALLSLICLVLDSLFHLSISGSARKELFVFMMGTACGPLMGAAIILPFVALLFHSIDTMTGLFIHIFPPMVAFTLRWYPERVHEAWPAVFHLDYLTTVRYFVDENGRPSLCTVAGSAVTGYVLWLVLYTLWMLLAGLDLPRKDRVDENGRTIRPKYDTCFHISMRGGACLAIGKKFWGRSKAESLHQMKMNHFERKDLLVYLSAHASMALLAIVALGYLCYNFRAIHGLFLVLLAVICAFRGARRYTYYTTSMYSHMLRKHFAMFRLVEPPRDGNHRRDD